MKIADTFELDGKAAIVVQVYEDGGFRARVFGHDGPVSDTETNFAGPDHEPAPAGQKAADGWPVLDSSYQAPAEPAPSPAVPDSTPAAATPTPETPTLASTLSQLTALLSQLSQPEVTAPASAPAPAPTSTVPDTAPAAPQA